MSGSSRFASVSIEYRGSLCQTYCEDLYRAEVKAKRDKVEMWVHGVRYESPGAFRRRMKIQGN